MTADGAILRRRAAESGRTQSVERAITLLTAVATADGKGSTVAELAARCDLSRATAWRLLTTLEGFGFVDRDRPTGSYSIGYTIVELASSARADGLVATAHPVLTRISAQTGETACLAIVGPNGLTYVDEVVPPTVVSAQWLGKAVPLHATSTGKAMLAWLPEEERRALLGDTLTAYTESTIADHNRLRTELHATREAGYGTCRGEVETSLFGVSAPVIGGHGRPLAVVSIWGPRERITEDRFPALGALVQSASAEIGAARRRLGSPAVAPP